MPFYKSRVSWNCLVSPFNTPFSKWYPGLLTLLVRLDWIRVNSYPNPTSWPGLSFTVYDLTLTNRIKRGFYLKKLSGFSNQHLILHPSARNLLTKSFIVSHKGNSIINIHNLEEKRFSARHSFSYQYLTFSIYLNINFCYPRMHQFCHFQFQPAQ